MRIEVHHYLHEGESPSLVRVVHSILAKVTTIMTTQAELGQKLDALTTQVTKIKTEVTGKLSELATAIENQGNVSPEVQEKLDALSAAVAGVDGLIDDAPAAPTV
jgi:fructose-1,6-bisphosphatase